MLASWLERRMLDSLARAFDDGGRLVGVSGTRFVADSRYQPILSAVAFQFEGLTVVFRAEADDDTLTATIGPLVATPGDEVIDLAGFPPWSRCFGHGVCWAWRLTNHQGYTDGVRLEFGVPGERSTVTVELVTVASGLRVFSVSELLGAP